MTVQNTTVKDIYVGNGATTKFPITFQMTDHPEYIKVYITGDDSVAVETENFSVDLGAKTVTYPANGDPLPDGHKITIYRELPLYQLMNLVNQGPFFAENIELSFDDLTFICQQLNEKLNRTLSTGIDESNFNNTFPVKAGMSFRINDAGDGLVLTEDPARVLPLAKDVLEQTKQVKESAVNETTNIKNTAIEELTAIKDAAVNETTEIKDEAVAAKNTAQTSKEAAEASANSASSSATTATEQADRAQGIADSLEGLDGITGIASTEEAIAGESDTKAMTPLKTKEAINEQTQNKADLVDGKVPKDQLPSSVYIPANSNLDLYLETGNYYSPTDLEAATILNAPLKTAFFLHVDRATELNSNQIIIHYPFNGRVLVRLYYAGAWSEWSELGTTIGDIFYRPYLMPGYVKANGATVIRTDYPNLVVYANDKNLWTSTPNTEPWKFGVGDGNTTMILPNYLNRVLQGGDSPAVLEAGLPNITGYFPADTRDYAASYYGGAFSQAWLNSQSDGYDGNSRTYKYTLDASKASNIYGASNTVQPPAIVLIPQIKY